MNSIRYHLERMNLTQDAIDWLLMLWLAIQVFDDVADGDEVSRNDLDATIWNVLVGMHQNAFFIAHSHNLIPVIATQILKWKASDTVERSGYADARSFMWRSGYYDVVLMVYQLVHGPAVSLSIAHEILNTYGEKLDDYMQEFNHA